MADDQTEYPHSGDSIKDERRESLSKSAANRVFFSQRRIEFA
jgi:hypothetical protein